MDYNNARMSQQFRSQSQPNGGRGKQQQNDSDALLRLVCRNCLYALIPLADCLLSLQTDREIAGCISDIGVQFSVEDLQKPNPQQIQKIFEWFAELLMNATRETVEPAMRAAAEDVCGEHLEIVPPDTRNLMGFYVSLRKLLVEVGMHIGYRVRMCICRANGIIVRYFGFLLQRPPKTYPRPPCQNLLLRHQLCPFPRVADGYY